MADRSISYSELWSWYLQHEHLQAQILHWLNLPKHLPIYTPEMQIEVMAGAPLEDKAVKAHLHLLHPRAKKALGLEEERVTKKKTWRHKALL